MNPNNKVETIAKNHPMLVLMIEPFKAAMLVAINDLPIIIITVLFLRIEVHMTFYKRENHFM